MIAYRFTEGFSPSNFKNSIPIYQLKFYDTPFTVKSSGITLKRYLLSDTSAPDWSGLSNLDLVDTLSTNIVGFYSGYGAMTGFHDTDNFALHYTGYFYAPHVFGNQFYTFKTYGFGYLRAVINTTSYLFGTGSTYLTLDSDYGYSSSVSLTAGSWNKIDIYYYTTLGESGFTFLWKNTDSDKFIPVSAGVVTKEGAYLSSTTIPDVISVEREEGVGDVSSLNFSIPLTVSGSTDAGYYYNSFWDKYCHSTEDIALDKFKMVEFEAGYKNLGQTDYIKKFIGHIETFRPKRTESSSVIEVECVGFENFYKQSINLNYPNMYDYWNAEYAGVGVSSTTPDGFTMPTTYDGWEFYKAFESLSIRAGIDPYLFLQKRTFLNSGYSVVTGTWLIERTSPNGVVLDLNLNYGNASVVNQDIGSLPDDEYILTSTFGEPLFDYVNTITDVYGWQWGSNPYYNGSPFLMSNNNPYVIYTTSDDLDAGYGVDADGSGFAYQVHLDAVGGQYIETNTAGDDYYIYYRGSKINAVIVGSTDSGYETTIKDFNADLDTLEVADGSNFAVAQVVIVETLLGEETSALSGVSGNTLTLGQALSTAPRKDGYVRTASFSAEVRRGTTWATATQVQVTYHSCYFNNDYDRLILTNGNKNTTPSSLPTKRYYYNGIDPKTSVNPTLVNIISDVSYDDYIVKFTRLTNSQAGATNYMRINALFVYDRDTNRIVETFYTGDSVVSGTVTAFEVEDSGVDLRNDTIVVGRRLGQEVPGGNDDRPLNPNNPTFYHIISRATDTASIYNPDARNYIGFPRQTIQIAPEIASVDRANYWSVAFINRYRNPRKFPSFDALGHPLMERGDCISVYDEGRKTLLNTDKFWITGIEETYNKKSYTTRFSTTSYEPWESYTPKIAVDPALFDYKPIQNLTLTNNGDGAGENASDNDTSAYDPYRSDYDGTKVEIKYDLILSGQVRIDIVPVGRPDLIVATLLNSNGSEGPEGWQKQDAGTGYVVTWDGVDMYGEWNKYCTENEDIQIGKNFYVCEGKGVKVKGQFYVKITVIRRDLQDTTVVAYSHDDDYLGSDGYIWTRRSSQASIGMNISNTCYFRDGEGFFLNGAGQFGNIVTFTDSVIHPNGSKMPFKVQIYDTTDSNSTYYSERASLFSITGNERYLSNRKIRLKIMGHNLLVLAGRRSGYPTSYQVIPVWTDVYYDNQDFRNYNYQTVFERIVNLPAFGYTYNYRDYVNDIWGSFYDSIYMGRFIYVEIEAFDKSGRLCEVSAVSPSRTKTGRINSNGQWVFWLDDISPYPNRVDSRFNASGYQWLAVPLSELGASIVNKTGTDVLTDDDLGIGAKEYLGLPGMEYGDDKYINLVRVKPKIDRYGNAWGY